LRNGFRGAEFSDAALGGVRCNKITSPPAEESEAGSRDHGRGLTNVVADGVPWAPTSRDRLLKAVSAGCTGGLVRLLRPSRRSCFVAPGSCLALRGLAVRRSCAVSASFTLPIRSIHGGRSLAPPSFPDRSTASAAAARNSSAAQSKYPRQIVRLSVRAARRFPCSCEQWDQGASGLI
jgi:hypothetical protein